jgi:hypothetical protein
MAIPIGSASQSNTTLLVVRPISRLSQASARWACNCAVNSRKTRRPRNESYISLMLDAEAVKERLCNYGGKIIVTNQATGTFIGRQSASPITNGTD